MSVHREISAVRALTFGPFQMLPTKRLLLRDGSTHPIGSRAFDLLCVLTERAGEVVTKRELIESVWPGASVEESALRFQIASLRAALRDGEEGTVYIRNVQGRGYCFVAAVRADDPPSDAAPPLANRSSRLPPLPASLIGRRTEVERIAQEVVQRRFVTIVGPGGVGKTSVAIEVGASLQERFAGGVYFVDLSHLQDPALVPGALMSALGLPEQASDALQTIAGSVDALDALIVLDNCEHVIESAAATAETLIVKSHRIPILATSREPLRADGERVHRLAPLESPTQRDVSADEALTFPAIQLFVRAAARRIGGFELTEELVGPIAEICRRLDGLPLAIELAASRIDVYGVAGLRTLVDGAFHLLDAERRSLVPRQQTLRATVEWSYDLLQAPLQLAFRRLSVFGGPFDIEAAFNVAGSAEIDHATLLDGLAQLVDKSLLVVDTGRVQPMYRFLEPTRAFARHKLRQSEPDATTWRRHATYLRRLLDGGGMTAAPLSVDPLAEICTALTWCFSEWGDVRLGVPLAAEACTFFIQRSALRDCRIWSQTALRALDDTNRDGVDEMRLQAALGFALMFTTGSDEEIRSALLRSLNLAERLNAADFLFQVIGALHMYFLRLGEFKESLALAERARLHATAIASEHGLTMAHWLIGLSQHLMGNQIAADASFRLSLSPARIGEWHDIATLGLRHHLRAHCGFARSLWLRGLGDQAYVVANQSIHEAHSLNHPITLCFTLIWMSFIPLWSGDLERAASMIASLRSAASANGLKSYETVARGLEGVIAVASGDFAGGVARLRDAMWPLHFDRYHMFTTTFSLAMAKGLLALGEWQEAMDAIDRAISRAKASEELVCFPEMLRLRGEVEAARPEPDFAAAEAALRRSLEMAQAQSALAWELRARMSLLALRRRSGALGDAEAQLAAALAQFHEGLASRDVMRARRLLRGDEL
jgi:predicted ATPase/DNA-binding winged helix-turn-helix (wHTH) protein